MPNLRLRDAEKSDFTAIQALYAHHVLHGLGSFEETPPEAAEMLRRWQAVRDAGLPYLVCASEDHAGRIEGFAYAATYRPRPAYRFAVEDSVYVDPDRPRRGIGRLLLSALIERCTQLGLRQMIAVIGDSQNDGSIGLHASLGFARVGCLPAAGFKHGGWVDVVLMQRPLGAGAETLPHR